MVPPWLIEDGPILHPRAARELIPVMNHFRKIPTAGAEDS